MKKDILYLEILKVLSDVLPGILYRCQYENAYTMEEIHGRCFELTGYQPHDMLQNKAISYGNLIHEDDRKRVKEDIQKAVKANRSYLLTYRIRTASGDLKWVWEQGKGIRDEKKELTGLVGFITDITLQKESERALQEGSELFRAIFEHTKVGISLIDKDGKIIDFNNEYLKTLGYRATELRGKNIQEISHPEDFEKENELLAGALKGNRDAYYKMEKRYLRKNGSWIWTRLSASILHDTQGKLVFGVGMVEDISEQKFNERVQKAIYEITQSVLETSNLESLFKEIHGILGTLTHVENFYIALFDNQDGLIHFPYYVDEYDEAPQPVEPGKGLTEYVLKTGKPLLAGPELFNNMVKQGKVETIGAPSIDWLGVPLRRGEKIIGVMVAQSYTEGIRFSKKDLHIFEIVSNQVAMAIERKCTDDALRSEENKLRTIFDATTDAIFLETLDGQILDCNDVALGLFGYSRDEILSLTVTDLLPEEVHKEIPKFINQQLLDGGMRLEAINQRKDGSLFPVEVSTRIALLDNRQLVVAFIRDITERKAVELAIMESETKFRKLAETSTALIAIITDTQILYANPATCLTTGYSQSELNQMDISDLLFPEEVQTNVRRLEERAMGIYTGDSEEVHIRAKSGHEIWLELDSGRINYDKNPALILTAIDITERHKAQEAMRLQSAALESAANAIVLTDREGRITWANQAYSQMTGYSLIESIGQTMDMLNSDVQDAKFFDQMWETIRGGNIWHGELINRRKDGMLYTEEMSITPVLTASGEVLNFVAIKQDITERTQHHRELTAIVRVSEALRTAITRADILPPVLEQVFELMNAKGVMLVMRDRLTGETVIQASKGEWERNTGQRLPQGEGIIGRVIETGKVYLTHDILSDPLITLHEFAETIQAVGCAPLIIQGQAIGAIMVGLEQPLTSNDMRILIAIADMVGSAIHRAELLEQTRLQAAELTHAYDATIEGWAKAMEMRDKETQGHTRRVTQMTIRLAQALGMIGTDLEKMRRGVLLHDIGKMGVPDTILLKPSSLDEEEWEIMHKHPQYALEMLQMIPYLSGSVDIPFSHHEHWDGSGYPRGLKSEEIPLPARIFAVVDVWDALTSDRPYRKAWSREDTRTYLQEQANILFDPRVVEAFLMLVDGGEI